MTEQLRIWAGVQGFLSLAALVALALFFALARPFAAEQRQWFWLGPVNDWLSVIGAVPWITAMTLFALHIRAGASVWVLTIVAGLGVAALAVVTVFMLAGHADLRLQTLTAIPATVIGFVWAAVAAAAARSEGVLPPWVAIFAMALLVALLIGLAAGGAGYISPSGSGIQTALYIVAGVVGGAAWFGFPAWWLAVAATAR